MNTVSRIAFALALQLGVTRASAGPVEDALASHCTPDHRLLGAARAALRPADHLDVTALRYLAERAGLAAPAVHAVVVRGDTDTARANEVAHWLGEHPTASTARCAVASDGGLVAVVLAPRTAAVSPLDHAAVQGSTRDYSFGLPTGGTEPAVVVTLPSGAVDRIVVAPDGPTHVRFRDPGEYTLQLVVGTDGGPAPFATWHVQVGDAPAETLRTRTINTPRDVLAAINTVRAHAGLRALRSDPFLTEVASGYARVLAARGEVIHETAPGDSPVARLISANVTAERVAENVARAPTLSTASARLLASPSHRANLLDEVIDAAGVGVASSDGEVYLVELLAAHPSLHVEGVR